MAAAMVWVAAPIVGLILVILSTILLGLSDGGGAATLLTRSLAWLSVTGFMLVWSPVFSWIGLLPAVPVVAWLLRVGRGGAGSFGLLGLALGAVCGAAIMALAGGTAIAFWGLFGGGVGLASALALRRALFWLEPEIFTKH